MIRERPAAMARSNCTRGASHFGREAHLPQGIVTDSQGNIYIGDTRDQRIRCVANTTAGCPNTQYPSPYKLGTISTYAGIGNPICESGHDNCGDGGAEVAGAFSQSCRTVDGCERRPLYCRSVGQPNSRGWPNTNASNQVRTLCGSGSAGNAGGSCANGINSPVEMYLPLAVVLDSLGNLTIADSGNSLIRQVPVSTNVIGTITEVEPWATAFRLPGQASPILTM